MEMYGRKIYYMSKEVCDLLKNTRLNIISIKINDETIDISPLKNKIFVA
jgi:hypothetical protein